MKKLIVAALIAGGMSAPALADHTPQHAFKDMTFESRGECQSALMQYRNENRASNHRSNSEYNQWFNGRFYCDTNRDGDWVVKIRQ